jgi:hypothetical protein
MLTFVYMVCTSSLLRHFKNLRIYLMYECIWIFGGGSHIL